MVQLSLRKLFLDTVPVLLDNEADSGVAHRKERTWWGGTVVETKDKLRQWTVK
jgi:hypothetical protein